MVNTLSMHGHILLLMLKIFFSMVNQIFKSYYKIVDKDHIKKYGQIYTNNNIANFMISWLMESRPDCIYDPAFGMGAFYYAARKQGFKGIFRAVEIDKISFNYFVNNARAVRLNLVNKNYFDLWSRKKFPCIVCNPPYLKFQNIINRNTIFQKLQSVLGIKISGYTNVASAFFNLIRQKSSIS